MDESIQYPSWSDVGLPTLIIDGLRNLGPSRILDYLILNRVMRFHIRAQYVYECHHCGATKRMHRHFEDYSSCERCNSNLISSTANWRMGKDKIEPYSSDECFIPPIIQQMPTVYGNYFRDHPPENFLKCEWVVDRKITIPQNDHAWDSYRGHHSEIPSDAPMFAAQFCCGERVLAPVQTTAICKAAILCPFLWDDCFDWKHITFKGKSHAVHITPLLHLWARLISPDERPKSPSKDRRVSGRRGSGGNDNPYPQAPPMPMPGDEEGIPDAVARALENQSARNILHEVFGHHLGENNG